ncbi:glycosyltransferase family 4 protein [Candidatus Curtissbacteria bacterium]|nr:glycosyltransferase family 4 protein [Candidatus Curtissbacteria bacterium]
MAKIAILSFYSQVVERGVETFALEIGKRLSQKHKVTVFHTGQQKTQNFAQISKSSGLNFVSIKMTSASPISSKGLLGKLNLDKQSFRILVFTLKVSPIIFKNKYDLIIPLNGGWQIAIVRILSKLTGSKILTSGHAGVGSDDAWNLLFRPDVFVALTSAQAKWAKRLAPEVKIALIPNGVDLANFNPKVKAKDIPLQKPVVICTSALVPYKRVELTIKAVAKAKDLSLLVLGDGEMRGVIDSVGKRILGKRYLRLVVPYDKMPAYYRAGNVFTLASKTEAFGISYVEAMACNLPVVTTYDSSREEIVGQAGILTNPVDIDQYAKDLKIASQTEYRNIPYNQALKYSWNKIAGKYSNLINQMSHE